MVTTRETLRNKTLLCRWEVIVIVSNVYPFSLLSGSLLAQFLFIRQNMTSYIVVMNLCVNFALYYDQNSVSFGIAAAAACNSVAALASFSRSTITNPSETEVVAGVFSRASRVGDTVPWTS